ncbi:hypothetical protein LEP1GSC079_1568 [Leptospira interrogans str. FPW1039]|uniref:Uncharacterized protein n=1 Tax=Leptospira interrogans str. FPW1039 TaxID=1193040 RepID=A0A0F6ICY1_LEPIR|nr:hypothetical protein LEP1GSC079_1568 [Leptospira interrogans str. FPW1039]
MFQKFECFVSTLKYRIYGIFFAIRPLILGTIFIRPSSK